MKKAFLFVLMALVLGLAGSGWAAVFNVTNETELRNALIAAESNNQDDTINIATGTYDTNGSTFSYSPALGPPEENYSLTIAGAGEGNTILDGGNSVQVMNIDTTGLVDDSNAHVPVRGITFQNGNTAADGGGLYGITNQANITVEDCEFSGNTAENGGGASIESVSPFSGNVIITNNTFTENTANTHGGGVIAFSGSGTLAFTNNVFDGNTADWSGGGTRASSSTGTVTFTNNTFSKNTGGGGGGGAFAIALFENTATANIYNNITWDNLAPGGNGHNIWVDDDSDGDGTGGAVNFYNNCHDLLPNSFAVAVGDNLSEGDNLRSDPLFIDPANGDFHLRANSVCIDAGTSAAPSLPATDFDGESRISGCAPDIGADEVPAPPCSPGGGGGGGRGSGGGLCFIATAAYGSPLSNEVYVLKQFRDEYLLTNELGRAFVSAYYKYSPSLADFIAKHPMARKIVRIGLYPILGLSKWLAGENASKPLPKVRK